MNPLALTIITANILGIFTDPFEFEGDYGSEVNAIRNTVFELVLDPKNSPKLFEVVTSSQLNLLSEKQNELSSFSKEDLEKIAHFVQNYGNIQVSSLLKDYPPQIMKLDKILRDKAAREAREFDLPILSSTALLQGSNADELKNNFLSSLFTEETLVLTKPVDVPENWQAFSSPSGQAFFFWLYHAANLQSVATKPDLIEKINFVKQQFLSSLGNPLKRAEIFKEKLLKANASVLFTQEADSYVPALLVEDASFYSSQKQNPSDGTLVFLRSTVWEENYELIPIDGYPGYNEGKLSLVLATLKNSGEKFLLASGHGNSTKPEDGRLQITLVAEKFHQLKKQYPELQLAIGIDANTKTDEDVRFFREHLSSLGLIATDVGPTTIKKRMITAQTTKAGHYAIDEEDYLIILKDGHFELTDQTIGFKKQRPDPSIPLPNIHNLSDHYPVGATLRRISNL